MKRWLSFVIAVVALAATPAIATASQDTVRYGPINSGSTDSGTCGPDWATDTYKRVFDVSPTRNTDGTYNVTESFIAGRFVTMVGSSPGACETPETASGMIRAGVTGTFNGTFTIIVSGGTFDPSATCDATSCGTTIDFVHTVYGSEATRDIPTFEFVYHANGPGLMSREWRNASLDLGGNSGDIRSS
jgi:hypothetical protein